MFGSIGFFEATFGFCEENYDEVQKKFLDHAVFSEAAVPQPMGCLRTLPGAEWCELHDLVKGRTILCGAFSAPSVEELRKYLKSLIEEGGDHLRHALSAATNHGKHGCRLSFKNVTGNALELHCSGENEGSVFQVASQFNYLEFSSPNVTPEAGINGYMFDETQGPACAIACGGGTAYRNYMVKMPDGTRGQRHNNQLNGLKDITEFFELSMSSQNSSGCGNILNRDPQDTGVDSPHQMKSVTSDTSTIFYTVKNGYVNSTAEQLAALNALIAQSNDPEDFKANAVSRLRVGVQDHVQVTVPTAGFSRKKRKTKRKITLGGESSDDESRKAASSFRVTQVYCSALSIGYARVPTREWEHLAKIVLRAAYEATLLVACINTVHAFLSSPEAESIAAVPVFLTKLGGGVFANPREWIVESIQQAITSVSTTFSIPMDIRLVHFRTVETEYLPLENVHEGNQDKVPPIARELLTHPP